jgi:hypothetical protein
MEKPKSHKFYLWQSPSHSLATLLQVRCNVEIPISTTFLGVEVKNM